MVVVERDVTRLVLLLFHGQWEVCVNRRRLLNTYNPDVAVVGLSGGPRPELAQARAVFGDQPDAVYAPENRDGAWHKKHTDLAVREWYMQAGLRLAFDVLHVLQ